MLAHLLSVRHLSRAWRRQYDRAEQRPCNLEHARIPSRAGHRPAQRRALRRLAKPRSPLAARKQVRAADPGPITPSCHVKRSASRSARRALRADWPSNSESPGHRRGGACVSTVRPASPRWRVSSARRLGAVSARWSAAVPPSAAPAAHRSESVQVVVAGGWAGIERGGQEVAAHSPYAGRSSGCGRARASIGLAPNSPKRSASPPPSRALLRPLDRVGAVDRWSIVMDDHDHLLNRLALAEVDRHPRPTRQSPG